MGEWGVMGDQPKSAGVLSRDEVQSYLDHAIEKWRGIRADDSHPHHDLAPFYIDAFQSARVSLLGGMLPVEAQSVQSRGPQSRGPQSKPLAHPHPEEKTEHMRQRERAKQLADTAKDLQGGRMPPFSVRRKPRPVHTQYSRDVEHGVGALFAIRKR